MQTRPERPPFTTKMDNADTGHNRGMNTVRSQDKTVKTRWERRLVEGDHLNTNVGSKQQGNKTAHRC